MRRTPFTLALLPGFAFVGVLEVMHVVEGERILVAFDGRPREHARQARERKLMLLTRAQLIEWTGVDVRQYASERKGAA